MHPKKGLFTENENQNESLIKQRAHRKHDFSSQQSQCQ
jgi:hypothetical protein